MDTESENKSINNDFTDLANVDYLLEAASRAIDTGQYNTAIENFGKVVEITRDVFGESIELMEVQRKINEIEKQLKDLETQSH